MLTSGSSDFVIGSGVVFVGAGSIDESINKVVSVSELSVSVLSVSLS